MLTANGCANLFPQARLLFPSSRPFASTARPGPTGIPDYTGELSDTEALSSLVLPPNPVTSKFSIIQIQGHKC